MLMLQSAQADDLKSITDKIKIEAVLKSVPIKIKDMPYKNLAERLPNLGLSVRQVTLGKLEQDEIKISQGLYKNGDVLYTFFTNEPNGAVEAICPIWSSFSLIKRANVWLSQDLTSNFLIKGYDCIAP